MAITTSEGPSEASAGSRTTIQIVRRDGPTTVHVSATVLRTIAPHLDVRYGEDFATLAQPGGVSERVCDGENQDFMQFLSVVYGANPGLITMEPKKIQKMAELADKYCMTSCMVYAGCYWLRERPVAGPEELWQLLTAAYWFNLREPFHRISRRLADDRRIWPAKLVSEMPDVALGLRLSLAIQELREARSGPLSTQSTDKHGSQGLCLDCFKTAEDSFLVRGKDCGTAPALSRW
ncbi:hypothetical protein AK830_g9391 [Neonectria ditissima]|uniref:BTB domain-containing protein n=1 Tax=Neonectria ditissima TaxID=78410 RepID=A0A0P7AUX1_9HYPO|nr:hypothetical protein AK830_g9391 [Neonectria ditissima]